MLHSIVIENFLSISERQELAFAVPGNAPDLSCFKNPLLDKDLRLPTVIGFFGPNASGKTTILAAILVTMGFARYSFDNEIAGRGFQAYRQKKWLEQPTKITIDFDGKLNGAHSVMFRYELHISHLDMQNKIVLYEALSYAPNGRLRFLFERKQQEFYFADEFEIKKDDPRKNSIRPNASVISTLVKFNHSLADEIHQQLLLQVSGFNRINTESQHEQQEQEILNIYSKNKDYLEQLNQELSRLDIGLESMSVELGPRGLFAKFKHTGLDGFILFGEESAGTRRFVNIFPRIHHALNNGNIALIDEIDTDFHPLLLPEIFRWFNSSKRNPHNAQLLFTAHNPSLLDELEKEQLFFTEKPCGQSTNVYGARDIKGLRREPSLMKKYLSGELGAVPHIG
ncbi:MAG: AAA family ATPase [Legionellales bacterium]|jgi:hypothetical protein